MKGRIQKRREADKEGGSEGEKRHEANPGLIEGRAAGGRETEEAAGEEALVSGVIVTSLGSLIRAPLKSPSTNSHIRYSRYRR